MVDALDVFLPPEGHLLRLCMVTSIVSLRLVSKSLLRELEPLVTFQVLRDMIGYIDTRTWRQVPLTCRLQLEGNRPTEWYCTLRPPSGGFQRRIQGGGARNPRSTDECPELDYLLVSNSYANCYGIDYIGVAVGGAALRSPIVNILNGAMTYVMRRTLARSFTVLALEDIDEVLYFFAELVLAEGTWMEYEDEVFELYASLNFVLRRVLMNQGGFECVVKIQGKANGLIDRDVILHSGLIMLSDHDI